MLQLDLLQELFCSVNGLLSQTIRLRVGGTAFDLAEIPLLGELRKLLCGKLRAVVGNNFLRDAMP